MGADAIVAGGQTSNPSAEEFVSAFRETESEDIIVLPNNKNVFLAAKQAAELYTDARVHIIPTASLMQGYAALSVITPGISDINAIVDSATRAARGIVGAEITRAVRTVTVNGKHISEGDYISISESDIVAVSATAEQAVLDMLSTLDMDDYEIITLFVGESVDSDTRVELTGILEEKYDTCEIEVYESGHAVYDYMIAVE